MNFTTVLNALPSLVPMVGQVLAVKDLVTELVDSFKEAPEDQATLKEAIEDLAAENDEGHARFQAKLAAAAQR